jgi:riboflavin kinase / FMN adenylyltransferase
MTARTAARISLKDGLPPSLRGAGIALGNFDGVHLGHQAVLDAARAPGEALLIATFEPHPRRFFQPDAPPFLLQSSAQRARAAGGIGVDAVVEITFDAALAAMDDVGFVSEVLVGALGAGRVAVGFDFTFGKGRMADADRLADLLARHGVPVTIANARMGPGGAKLSSTGVRDALAAGNVAAAAGILGRPFAIEGTVIHGFARGRTIGVPTANLALGDYARPLFGVYAVQVALPGGRVAGGVANIGVRPTVGGTEAPLLEAHIFDLDEDLYGQTIEVALEAFLRPEQRFESFDALKAQIAADIDAARQIIPIS